MGSVPPETQERLLLSLNIRVYTIGVGTRGMAPFPAYKTPTGQIIFQNMESTD